MSGRALKWIIYIWGAVSLLVFVAVRFQPIFNALLKEKVVENYWDKTKYGELYYFSMIRHFREPDLPPSQTKFEYSDKQARVGEADILTFGDSYFEISRTKQFPQRLAEDFGKKVHYVNFDHPLAYLVQNHYSDTTPKLVLYERTERYIPFSFLEEQKFPEEVPGPWTPKSLAGKVKDFLFYDKDEELYNVILKRSYVTTALYTFFTTLKFDLYGGISSLTPKYYINGSDNWLFYHDQVNGENTSFYYQPSQADIDSICDHMAGLARTLKEKYNLVLVYLPVPAKYTVYHTLINNDTYNNLLPRVYEGLKKRGVPFVDIFDDFMNAPEPLYYRTDSHWNQKGLDLAYKRTIETLMADPRLSVFLKP